MCASNESSPVSRYRGRGFWEGEAGARYSGTPRQVFTEDIFWGCFLRAGKDKEADNFTDRKAIKNKKKQKKRTRSFDELEAEN